MTGSLSLEPLARFVPGGAGALPDHPISRHSHVAAAQVDLPDSIEKKSTVPRRRCAAFLFSWAEIGLS
jgi:hypothetical protein